MRSLAVIERQAVERKLRQYRVTVRQQADLLALAQAKLERKIAYRRKSARQVGWGSLSVQAVLGLVIAFKA